MDLDFLEKRIEVRKQEFEENKNRGSRHPVYVVYDLCDGYVSGWSEFSLEPNCQRKTSEFGFLTNPDENGEYGEFVLADKFNEDCDLEKITRYWYDRWVEVFMTSEAAHAYLEYQSHNLSNPYTYVHNTGYRNNEMDTLLSDEG